MARAGYCAECSANAWLDPDGSCANGHAATSVSNEYEAGAPVPVAAQAARRSATPWIVLSVALLLLTCIVGACAAIAVPVFLNASANAELKSCQANQRTVTGAVVTYMTENPEADFPTDWQSAMADLIPGMLRAEPRCPSGGAYTIAPDDTYGIRLECSVHGDAVGNGSSAP